jgi:SAM-dependent methyltransferase
MIIDLKNFVVSIMPKPLVNALVHTRNRFRSKNKHELDFWKSRFKKDDGVFEHAHFEKYMLGMAEEKDDSFLRGKVVADFGCGPRGSLVWAKSAKFRIGIDVLADKYADEFTDNIVSHGMIYLKSTEKVIPLPSDFVDIMFTINAIDHVDSFHAICKEILRVIKPGGYFIGSFNLEEPATTTEPQQLNENKIKKHLLEYLEVESYRITNPGPQGNQYQPFFDGKIIYQPGEPGILWVKAKKPEPIYQHRNS